MPKRLGTLLFQHSEESLRKLCEEKNLNSYEKEIIIRIYSKRQSLNYIADMMRFDIHGKRNKFYSVRTINNIHKEAFKKLGK